MLEAHPAILRLDVSSPTYAAKIEYLRGLLDVSPCCTFGMLFAPLPVVLSS